MYIHILIPTDGSQLATQAVDRTLQLATTLGARVTFLMVMEPFHALGLDVDQRAEAGRSDVEARAVVETRKVLAEASAKAKVLGVEFDTLFETSDLPYEAIISTAQARGCDLIAMASHGRSGFAAVLLGSTTTKVLTHSKLPVLVYR
ncbi:universal stress protein [uncultured Amaricoccus sp.]|uniref:universal stress protein n=1 Tax=uncultured Amaricoccus sp. TaxID=339341 RepID=UPI002636CC79|nr:universal stress protein [uncultured Amaricoccus sp.]